MPDTNADFTGFELLSAKQKKRFHNYRPGEATESSDQHASAAQLMRDSSFADGFVDNFDLTLLIPPQPNDRIIAAALPLLEAYNSGKSMNHFANPLSIRAVDNAAFSAAWSEAGSHFYA